jgi:hypothetical protein
LLSFLSYISARALSSTFLYNAPVFKQSKPVARRERIA